MSAWAILPAAACLLGFLVVTGINLWVWRTGSRHIHAAASVPRAPVCLVLGARAWPGGIPSHALEDRLLTARALLELGKVEVLLLSGDNRPGHGEVDVMETFLLGHGVTRGSLLRDEAAVTTHASLVRARDLFNVRRVTLVTQAFHLPRALYAARRLGLEACGVASDRRRYSDMAWTRVREAAARVKAFTRRH